MSGTVFSELSSKLSSSYFYYDAEMKNYSSMRVGGKPAALIIVEDSEDFIRIFDFFRNKEYKLVIIGKCSNMIFGDNLKNYVVIGLGENFNKISVNDNLMNCSAGVPLQQAVRKTAEFGLSGFEWAMGIPGTIGGAITNNAGSGNRSVIDSAESVMVINYYGERRIIKPSELNPAYRTTDIKIRKNLIILGAVFRFEKADRLSVLNSLNENFTAKQNSQPLNEFSAGCIFKNPEGLSAGKLIDESGLKGKIIGGAGISTKHANFIINSNNASFADIMNLIDLIKNTVLKKFNIELELEVEIISG
ncbi:MAG TPA: UDP-N-acetylmuramate dehydrogenase [bacterium]|nr:UDP-N-acetylmuramate dehydrogenase [bacterium]HPN32350.1 UDP-N-acetylmuramate dehydrogenase [bacterium]